jgi:hypothetical protein
MILPAHRKIAYWLVRLKIWSIEPDWLWSIPRIKTGFGTQWLYRRMLRSQKRDGLHHAPACPGNEWDGQYLVLKGCTCGARRQARSRAVVGGAR